MSDIVAGLLFGALGGFAVLAVGLRWHRRITRLEDEVLELQGAVDLILVAHGRPAYFAERYDLEIVSDLEAPGGGAT